MPREDVRDFAAVVAPAALASLLTLLPLENYLSVYPVPPVFTWYAPWRGAFTSLILWIVSGALYSEKRYWLKEVFLGAAASFLVFHYWLLYTVSRYVAVSLLPLVYFVGESPPVLDLGQVVFALTLVAFRREIARALRKSGST